MKFSLAPPIQLMCEVLMKVTRFAIKRRESINFVALVYVYVCMYYSCVLYVCVQCIVI